MPVLALGDSGESVAGPAETERLASLVREQFAYVWRLCRRLGLPEGDAEDAAQQVFLVAARRLADIRGGSERPFLYGVAVNQAAKWRASHARRREQSETELDTLAHTAPGPEELLTQKNAQRVLDALLESMPDDLRVVFVLYEIEQQTVAEIAVVLDVPVGTAASRLRRAREDFRARLARLEARRRFEGAR